MVQCHVNRRVEYVLEISKTYMLQGPKKAIEWVKKTVAQELNQTNDMSIKC